MTSHNFKLLERILEEEDIFETVMIQYNYLYRQPAEDFLRLCRRKNIGTIVMKPLGGSYLRNARVALKFVLSNENVNVVIVGMGRISEVKENMK